MNRLLLLSSIVLACCSVDRGYAQQGPPAPANKVDSLLKKQLAAPVKAPALPGVPGGLGLPGVSGVIGGAGAASTTAKQPADPVLGMVKNPMDLPGSPAAQLQQQVKLFEGTRAVSVGQLSVDAEYTYFADTAGLGLGLFNGMAGTTGYSINGGVTLAGMPFNLGIREANGINTLNYTPYRNFYQFNFNHEQYLQELRNRLLAKLSPEALMNSALKRVDVIRNNYETELKGEVTSIQRQYASTYRSAVTLPAGATNLGASDMAALRTQLMPGDSIQKYQRDQTRLQDMISRNEGKPPVHDSTYQATLASTKRFEATEQIFNRIAAYRKKFTDNPIVKQLLSTSMLSPNGLKAYLANPDNLSQVLDDQTSMSMVQRLFVNIKQLDMGQNAVNSGELNLQNVVNTGVNTEFQNKSTTVGMIYGQNNNQNSWLQAGLQSQLTNEYSNLTGFKLGTGSGSPIQESISFDMFHMTNASVPGQGIVQQPGAMGAAQGSGSYLPVAPYSDGAITLHTGFQLTPKSLVTLDLSKSFGQYRQTGVPPNGESELPKGSVFGGGGKSNYAGLLNFTGEVFKTDLKVYIKKVGLGYYNPGNYLLHSGETEYGLGLSRRFLNKLTIKYDADYRKQVYDPDGNYTYTAFSNKFQLGYKIDRSDKVNLTYQRSDYRSAFYGQAQVYGLNSRLQLDGAYRFAVDGKKITNNVTISRTETSIPLTTGGNYVDNALLITNTSTILVRNNPLSLTLLSNTSDNTSYIFNTSMFTAETNYGYLLPGWPRMSSAIGYYSNAAWNKQVGVRQQVSAIVGKKLNLDLMVSYRKAVQIIQSALANQLFVNATVHYTFN